MDRRRFLATASAGSIGALAGCNDLLRRRPSREPPLVADRPDTVYIPTHIDGMGMIGMKMSGRLHLMLSFAWPHRFWLIDGDNRNKVSIEGADDVHFMLSALDMDTGVAIPTANPSFRIRKGETIIADKQPWRMVSQRMGVHYGDNYTLDGEGTYEIDVEFGPVETRTTGEFHDSFESRVSHTFSFEFDHVRMEKLLFKLLENAGKTGALDPMEMHGMPIPQLKKADVFPGIASGTGTSGDATFVVSVLDSRPTGVDGTGQYLAVSPRTPYNRYALPFMAIHATLARGNRTVFDRWLTPTIDSTLGFHYGFAPDTPIEPGETIELSPATPPQISRHEGYETAFLEMTPLSVELQ